MASLTFTRTWECASQNHITINVTGDVEYTFHGDMDDLTGPVTEADKAACLKVLLRIAKIGRTRAQIRNALANGYTVTI